MVDGRNGPATPLDFFYRDKIRGKILRTMSSVFTIILQISDFNQKYIQSGHLSTITQQMNPAMSGIPKDNTVAALRKVLTSETEPLARRFRALFSLKHFACMQPNGEQTLPAIEAIAAAFTSSSELLKHELAYCLGQSNNLNALPHLVRVLEDRKEDAMCRHEAAEALGALGYTDSLDILKTLRDDQSELDVVRETCDIAVDRILWSNSLEGKGEPLKPRSVLRYSVDYTKLVIMLIY